MRKVNYKEKGITLIALVVTIIILLILAGVTLTTALSQNGLFQRAKIAGENYKKAEADETEKLGEVEREIDKIIDGETPSDQPKVETGPTGKPLPKTVTSTEHDTETYEDSLGNPVVIPGGFKFAGEPDDTVQDGIIIEDDEQNQFVWIPVSNTNEDKTGLIKKEDGTTVEIALGRYTFASSNLGTPTPKQLGANHSERSKSTEISSNYYEDTNGEERPNGGKGAKNLAEFITSVEKNHGYYIARYEASFGSGTAPDVSYDNNKVETIMTNQKPYSKPSTNKGTSSMSCTVGTLWNFITQGDASKVSQNMYSEGDTEAQFVESDLVNSYAWDTAIVYIQKMGNENYANAKMQNSGLMNTGETGDERCHIFDMAGNVREWTTEYSTFTNSIGENPCVYRGGIWDDAMLYVASRSCDFRYYNNRHVGFRPLLYLKEL